MERINVIEMVHPLNYLPDHISGNLFRHSLDQLQIRREVPCVAVVEHEVVMIV